ncbi:MAG TPA: hypothetical protein EYP67_00465 [Methanosarcinales archaeon]|nr:hypothetical protein [Methanosarcinales archaeon]
MQATEIDSQDDTVQIPTRDEALKRLSEVVDFCEHKLQNGRIKDPPNERIRQGWANATINGLKAYLAALRDAQLDDIDTRLTALEAGRP